MENQLIGFVFVLVSVLLFTYFSIRSRGRTMATREIPLFESLTDLVGRAAEQGNMVHAALGQGSLMGEDAMTSITALQSLQALITLSAAYDTPPLITTGDPTLYLLARDRMRRAYARIGNAPQFRPQFVQFVAGSPVTYAAMAATYIFDGGIQSNLMLGAFDREVSLLADASQRRGIMTSGGVVSMIALSALYPVVNHTKLVIGEDLFVGPAIITEKPENWASLWTQDLLRWLLILGILGVAGLSLMK